MKKLKNQNKKSAAIYRFIQCDIYFMFQSYKNCFLYYFHFVFNFTKTLPSIKTILFFSQLSHPSLINTHDCLSHLTGRWPHNWWYANVALFSAEICMHLLKRKTYCKTIWWNRYLIAKLYIYIYIHIYLKNSQMKVHDISDTAQI